MLRADAENKLAFGEIFSSPEGVANRPVSVLQWRRWKNFIGSSPPYNARPEAQADRALPAHRSKKLVGHLMRLHATSARLAIRSELAQMKGQMVAIEQASVAKKCDIQFQGKPKD